MTAKDAIKLSLKQTEGLTTALFGDLSDADLQTRPVPGANNIAWQLGHLTASERQLLQHLPGADYPELPADLAALSSGKTAVTNPDGGGFTKAEHLEWFGKVRAATLATVDRLSDADFDKPNTGPMKEMAPTIGALLLMVCQHTMMHQGQFSVVRRALEKPVLF